MQAAFMDTTPAAFMDTSGKPTIAQKMKVDLDVIIENLDKGTWKSSLKVPL